MPFIYCSTLCKELNPSFGLSYRPAIVFNVEVFSLSSLTCHIYPIRTFRLMGLGDSKGASKQSSIKVNRIVDIEMIRESNSSIQRSITALVPLLTP